MPHFDPKEAAVIRTGRVLSAQDGMLRICFQKPSSCEGCKGCGSAAESQITLAGPAAASEGDTVLVRVPDKSLLLSAFIVYVLPLCVFLMGLIVGKLLSGSDTVSVISALAGLLISYFILRKIDRKKAYTPTVISVIPASSAEAGLKADD